MAKQRRICLKAVVDEKGRKCVESAVIRDRAGLIKVYIVRGDKRGRILKKIAELPMIKLIRDPSGDLYVASNGDGKIIDVSPTLRTLLELLVDRGYIVPLNMLSRPELQIILNEIIEVDNGFVDAGVTFEGIVDPRGVGLDLEERPERAKILEDIARWVEKAYRSERNRKIALANVAFLLAKVLSPAIRMKNKTFIDHFIWNVGRGGEGKSSLVVYVMLPLLGVDEDINDQLFIYIRGAVRTAEQARNLIALNRMPLILDEQTKSALSRNVDIIMSSAIGSGIIGVHASKYGGGVGFTFKSYRGVIVFTNVHFSEFLRDVVREASDYAITRRVIELEWDNIKINEEAFKDLENLKIRSILGNLDAMWRRHKDELLRTTNIKELAMKVLELLEKEYKVDLKTYREAIEEVWSQWESGKTMLVKRDEDQLIERALDVARRMLGETNITSLKLLESIIENPHAFGIKFTYAKNDVEEQEEIKRLRGIICKSIGAYNPQDPHMLCGSSVDVKQELYLLDKKLRNYYENGKLFVVIKSRSALCPGTPKTFLGVRDNIFSDGGVKFTGYKIALSKFIEIFIDRTSAKEHGGEMKGGHENKENNNIGKNGPENPEGPEAIDTAGAIKDFEPSPSSSVADHSNALKSDTAIIVSGLSGFSGSPGHNNISSSGFEALKKALKNVEPGCYSEDELRQKLGELYDVVVSNLGIAKDNKICLGVDG